MPAVPLVNIRWFPGRSEAQKTELVARITQAFCEVAGSTPEHVTVIFEETAPADWYVAGRPANQPPR